MNIRNGMVMSIEEIRAAPAFSHNNTNPYLFRTVHFDDWEKMNLDGRLYDIYDSEQDKYSLIVYPHLGYALRRGLEEEGEFHRLLAIPAEKYLPGGVSGRSGLAVLEALGALGQAVSNVLAIDLEQAVRIDEVIVPDSLNSLIAVCPAISQQEIDLFYGRRR